MPVIPGFILKPAQAKCKEDFISTEKPGIVSIAVIPATI
jgi:hypothetical protein